MKRSCIKKMGLIFFLISSLLISMSSICLAKAKTNMTVSAVQDASQDNTEIETVQYTIGLGEKINYKLPTALSRSASELVYKSSNKNIACVNKSGKITGLAEGSATVTIKQNDVKKVKIKIKVKKAPSQITIYNKAKKMTMYKKWTRKLEYSFGDGEVSNKTTFTSSDPKVLSVSKSGKLTAKKAGKSTITIKAYNGVKTKIKVTVKNKPKSKSSGYPKVITDKNTVIRITRTWYKNAYVYAAHIQFNDFKRFGTLCANNGYNKGSETVKRALSRKNALFGTNGCYSAPYLGYTVARGGKVCHNGAVWTPGVYNANTGIFSSPEDAGCAGMDLKTAVKKKLITDTFCFGPAFLIKGKIQSISDSSRAQRTFMGSNGTPGDIWVCVSEGRGYEKSSGLTYNQCAQFLKDKGCYHGIPLDGGGSSGMYTKKNGMINQTGRAGRSLVDFVIYK